MNPDFRNGLYRVDPKLLGLDAVLEEEAAEAKEKVSPNAAAASAAAAVKKAKAPAAIEPSADIVAQLEAMGMTPGGAAKAAVATKNAGFDQAMDFYFAHENEKGFHDDNEGSKGKAQGGGKNPTGKKAPKARGPPKVQRTLLELQRLFAQLQLEDRRSVETERLTKKGFNFKPGEEKVQHDVQELITKLLDKLDMEMCAAGGKKGAGKKGSALIAGLFEYESRTELVCQRCGEVSGPPVETNKNLFVPVKGFPDVPSALAEAFKASTTLTQVYLGNNIADAGAAALAEAFLITTTSAQVRPVHSPYVAAVMARRQRLRSEESQRP